MKVVSDSQDMSQLANPPSRDMTLPFEFRYEDGQNNLVDETGAPALDETDIDDCLPLERLTDLIEYTSIKISLQTVVGKDIDSISVEDDDTVDETKKESMVASKTRNYRIYSIKDRERFFEFWIVRPHWSIAAIAKELRILSRNAQRWVKEFKEQGEVDVPVAKPRGKVPYPKLNDDHKEYLTKYVEENPSAILDEMMDNLSETFMDLTVSRSTLHSFLKKECAISFKLARKESVERNSSKKIQERFDFVTKVLKSGIEYLSNCVFIDEAGFNINMKRSGAWAPRGNTPVVKTPSTRAENLTILGAICTHGIVQLSLRKPRAPLTSKKRKVGLNEVVDSSRGTITGHYKQFLLDVMDVLDKSPYMRNCYLVMDNASIHKSLSIGRIIQVRGYRVLYLPPFSPELNPIEQFWHQLKSKLKREKLLSKETLQTRITEAANLVPLEFIQNTIKHSESCFSNCLEKKPL